MDTTLLVLRDSEPEDLEDARSVCTALQTSNEDLEIFFEECSSLYNLVLDALHCLTSKTISCEYVEMLAARLEEKARDIFVTSPELENTVSLRLNTVCSAMEQLRLRNTARQQCAKDSDTLDSSKTSLCTQMRNWLNKKEHQLAENKLKLRKGSNLTKVLSDQKVLQQEVKSEGQTLVNRIFSQLRREEIEKETSEKELAKKKTTIEVLRKKWLAVYLDSLSLTVEIENKIEQYQESESESDPDFRGPPQKRSRRISVSSTVSSVSRVPSNTRPSLASPLSSGRGTIGGEVTDEDDDEFVIGYGGRDFESVVTMEREAVTPLSATSCTRTAAPTKWDSVQQDIGYSSGENSGHDPVGVIPVITSPPAGMHRRRIECTPVKAFYRTVQLEDMSDLEVNRAINKDVDDELSDSMYMNVDTTNVNAVNSLTEFDEVMALMDDGEDNHNLSTSISMTDSFNTKWSEIRSRKTLASVRGVRRQSAKNNGDESETLAKSSCDASSEDSSECDTMEAEELAMSCSFNSSVFENSSPLKRQRSRKPSKTSMNLLDQIGLEESFCSTRSELVGQKWRTSRRKLRVRRMPRSMSDGEQLGVVPPSDTNHMVNSLVVTMPDTPTSRSSLRLLKRLDDDLRREDRFSESDTTVPEQSDAQVYEWDEYSPLAKNEMDEELVAESTPTRCAEDMFTMDDDFSAHFGGQTILRLVEESRVHLETVHKTIECGNLAPNQLRNIDVIVSANLRRLDHAVQNSHQTSTPNRAKSFERSQLEDLRTQWHIVYEQLLNPVTRILAKVEKFANSLQETSTLSALNGVHAITNKDDARLALEAVLGIKDKLNEERMELRELIDVERSNLVGALGSDAALNCISEGYDEAVTRISQLVDNLSGLNDQWSDWNEKRNLIAKTMSNIESYLKRDTDVDQQSIVTEMELCQERMDSLETACNYLSSTLKSLQGETAGGNLPDLHSEVSIFSNALAQLRAKLDSMTRVPTPPIVRSPKASPTPRRRLTKSKATQSTEVVAGETPIEVVKSSRLIKTLLLLAFLAALGAFINHYVAGHSFGPHVEYVNGMPPY